MKLFKVLFLLMMIATAGLTLSSCGGSGSDAEKQGIEYTYAYICPMHCTGSGSASAGTCPVCKMDYVANKDLKPKGQDDHGHSHDHGHDHGHEGHSH